MGIGLCFVRGGGRMLLLSKRGKEGGEGCMWY